MIERTDIIRETSQHIENFTQTYQRRVDIPQEEIKNLMQILKKCNDAIEAKNVASDREMMRHLSKAVINLTPVIDAKTAQEKVAAVLASLVQEKTRLEKNLREDDKVGRKVERSNQSKGT